MPMQAQRGEEGTDSNHSQPQRLRLVGGQHHASAALPRERPGTHIVGWVGLRAGLHWHGKPHPPPRFDPRTVQL
jgi:hypothetical protein